jgi:hypothetical protein
MMVMIKLAWRLVYHTCYHCVHERDFLFFHLIQKCSVKIVMNPIEGFRSCLFATD